MAYRMLVTDLDYTCLNEEHEIPEGNIIAARRANEEGILFSVATGRGRVAAERHIMKLNPNLPVILQNGMNIFDFARFDDKGAPGRRGCFDQGGALGDGYGDNPGHHDRPKAPRIEKGRASGG